jgi:5'(3')-deoxyribonucleotidase
VSKTFVIGLDLDGVCYQFEKTARYMIRRRIQDRGEIPNPGLYVPSHNWDWIKDHCPKQDFDWLWETGVSQGLFRYGHVVTGAIEGVQEINELGDVVAITARPKAAVHDTLVWLSTMFDKAPLSGLVIQSDQAQHKSQVKPNPDVFIDDGIHNFTDVLDNTDSFLIRFEQPWNADYEAPYEHWDRYLTANGWRETVEQVRWVKEHAHVNSR